MPKEGGKLSEPEIATLRQWVELGTPWPDLVPPSGARELARRYGMDLEHRLSVVGREIKIYLLLLFAVVMGAADRIREIVQQMLRITRLLPVDSSRSRSASIASYQRNENPCQAVNRDAGLL